MKQMGSFLSLILWVFGLGGMGWVNAALPVQVNDQALPSLAPMLEKSMPAVVNIATTQNIQVVENPLLQDPFFRHFFQIPNRQTRKQKNSLGSGVIIDKHNGFVLTNHHVIDKADHIMVTLTDGRQLDAQLLGADPASDVAVIKIAPDNLTELPLADSDELKVGDFVVAIGNPFGLGQTVTSGIISALGRSGLGIEGYEDFIQTDASINPGNSGGALVNLRGELVGMNTAILAPNGGNVGIGFAIPSNMAISIKESLIKHGEVRRGYLGVTTQDLTPDLIKAFDLPERQGVIVSRVEENSAAAQAGLETGDIIMTVDGQQVKNSYHIRNRVGLLEIGDQVTLDILRHGKKLSLVAVIAQPEQISLAGETLHSLLAGIELTMLEREGIEGVSLSKVERGGYAWQNGLRPGDMIISANRYRVKNLDQLKQVIDPRRPILLNIQRGSGAFFLVLQ
jgi:Do/DeqQ family serine protease